MTEIVDLIELFLVGSSGNLRFGSTSPADLQKLSGHDDEDGGKGPIPFSSWITSFDGGEFFFQGSPPFLYGLKLLPSPSRMGWGGGRTVAQEFERFRCGDLEFRVRNFKWAELLTLASAIRFSNELELGMKGDQAERTIYIGQDSNGRDLSFEYRIEPLPREGGMYEFDYFLHAIRLNDMGVDAILSKTLPEGSGTRRESLTALKDLAEKRLSEKE